jgi:hypothetical protein
LTPLFSLWLCCAQGRGFADGGGEDREFGAAFESLEASDAAGPARCAFPSESGAFDALRR